MLLRCLLPGLLFSNRLFPGQRWTGKAIGRYKIGQEDGFACSKKDDSLIIGFDNLHGEEDRRLIGSLSNAFGQFAIGGQNDLRITCGPYSFFHNKRMCFFAHAGIQHFWRGNGRGVLR